MRRFAALAALLALGLPAQAIAAGGPVPPSQNAGSVSVPGSPFRYTAGGAGRFTVVRRLARGGAPAVTLRLRGQYGIPGVDYNGQQTGLSADGNTLVLAAIQRYYPPRGTSLIVLDTRTMAVRARIALPGWSNVDAISPDGRWIYLIHYVPSDPNRYSVLGYDLTEHRLLPHPIIDPRDRGEAMSGYPAYRVMSSDGRWAYTLYLRSSGSSAFVHALDTVRHRAVCIDLPASASFSGLSGAKITLGPGGATLLIQNGGITVATVDTRTFVASPPGATVPFEPTRAPARTVAPSGDDGIPWMLIAGPLLALAALGGVATRRRPIT
jgi:hypothetical protein